MARVLIYSHDSFGLGHIRRCRTIAHALADAFPKLRVLIVSGSPIIGSFDFKTRVDFVRVPSIIKLRNGDYVPLDRHSSIQEMTELRASLIADTAIHFAPDLVIVDKEPLGLRGELEGTLDKLKARGARLVLGLRDVMDEPEALAKEWARKRAAPALEELYDDIWIYGLKEIYDPLQGIALSNRTRAKMRYAGYLRRTKPAALPVTFVNDLARRILITTGGGGDGEALIDWILSTYEAQHDTLPTAAIVLGPFMRAEARSTFEARAAALGLPCEIFEPRMEHLLADCRAVVSMGGYNTFCEILSFDKSALIVPRHTPRFEQSIRAEAAERLGLARTLPEPAFGTHGDIALMANALRGLPTQPPPSAHPIANILSGIDNIVAWSKPWLT
ncbi:MAG: hypothetical protein GC190_02145 [Alphaproteobacteria bacterium]|nr:hypothetical protein [Alphaproteobacteria bacterium]